MDDECQVTFYLVHVLASPVELPYLPGLVHQKLGEVLSDGHGCHESHPEQLTVPPQESIDVVSVGSIDVHLGHHWEVHLLFFQVVVFYLLVTQRFIPELVAREGNDLERVLVFLLECLESSQLLPRERRPLGHIDHQNGLVGVVPERLTGAGESGHSEGVESGVVSFDIVPREEDLPESGLAHLSLYYVSDTDINCALKS